MSRINIYIRPDLRKRIDALPEGLRPSFSDTLRPVIEALVAAAERAAKRDWLKP